MNRVVGGLTFGACVLAAALPRAAMAADADVQTAYTAFVQKEMPGVPVDLVQAAKNEGQVNWYSLAVPYSPDLAAKFQEIFPFVKLDKLTLTGGALVAKFRAESEARQGNADVVQMSNFADALKANDDGFVANYHLSSQDEFNMSLGRADHIYPINGDMPVIAYNPQKVHDADVTGLRKWSGLFDPRWDNMQFAVGEVMAGGTQQVPNYYFYKTFGTRLWERMAKSGYNIFPGGTLATNSVISGATDLGVAIPVSELVPLYKKGAPIHWINPQDWISVVFVEFISAQATHPNAARLLLEFLASPTGQAVAGNLGATSLRKDYKPVGDWTRQPWFNAPDTTQFWPYDITQMQAALPEIAKQWRAIFK